MRSLDISCLWKPLSCIVADDTLGDDDEEEEKGLAEEERDPARLSAPLSPQ